jgi:hypothetical protein
MSNYEKVKKWRELNPEKVLEQARRYRAKHPDTNKKAKVKYRQNNLERVRENERRSQAERRKQDPEAQRIRYTRWRANHEARLTAIAGRVRPDNCEICDSSEYKIVFDHCHVGGQFRGWICDQCNKVLGLIKDSVVVLSKMIDYLEDSHVKVESENQKQAPS